MLKLIGITIAVVMLLSACKKDNKSNQPTIIDASILSINNTVQSDVVVKLLSDEHRLAGDFVAAATSNNNGKADFTVTPGKTYYLYHYAADNEVIENTDATYIITGKFTSQQQINDSPAQTPAAQVGDNIDLDINGDGIIDGHDKVIKVTAPIQGTTTVIFVLGN